MSSPGKTVRVRSDARSPNMSCKAQSGIGTHIAEWHQVAPGHTAQTLPAPASHRFMRPPRNAPPARSAMPRCRDRCHLCHFSRAGCGQIRLAPEPWCRAQRAPSSARQGQKRGLQVAQRGGAGGFSAIDACRTPTETGWRSRGFPAYLFGKIARQHLARGAACVHVGFRCPSPARSARLRQKKRVLG